MKLTSEKVESMPLPAKGQRFYWGHYGLGLRITAAGSRAYVFQYRDPDTGKTVRRTIGKADKMSFDAAETEAIGRYRAIRDGKKEDKHLDKWTVADLREFYEKVHLKELRPNTQRDDKGAYQRYVSQETESDFRHPALSKKLVKDVKNIDIRELHLAITDYGNPYMAERVRMLLSAMFSYAIDKRIIAHNPCRDRRWKKWKNNPVNRDRFLNRDELERVYAYLDGTGGWFANFVRLLLLTGCRRSELEAATWSQFDIDERRWTKPDTKTGEHSVRIFPEAVTLLERMRPRDAKDDDWVFPAPTGSGHVENPRTPWKRMCIACDLMDIDEDGKATPNFTPHDCRHSFATYAVKAGVRVTSLQHLLNHKNIAMTMRYYHIDQDDEDEALKLMSEGPLTGAVR